MNKIPRSITTTQLQRQPKILDELKEKNETSLIIRDSLPLGVFTPIDAYNRLMERLERLENEEKEALKKIQQALDDVAKGKIVDADKFFKVLKE